MTGCCTKNFTIVVMYYNMVLNIDTSRQINQQVLNKNCIYLYIICTSITKGRCLLVKIIILHAFSLV